MPGLDLTQVSGNWKKLQAQISTNTRNASPRDSAVLKRRRDETETTTDRRQVKKLRKGTTSLGSRYRLATKMGNATSTNNTEPAAQTDRHADLQEKFDVSATDIDAAYGGAVQLGEGDEINGGRHKQHKAGKYLALDCEMVGTGPPPHIDNLLARVSIVNFHGEQVYDSYVLPARGSQVEDYRTHVSGIRREHLRPGTARPFADVQREVSDLLNGKILVGHALRKDMQVLQLDHPKRDIRDTSRYAPYRIESRGKPPALRHLAKNQLGMNIQKGEHSSIEDARATMMLYKKEKTGFEAEARKQFGVVRQVKTKQNRAEPESPAAVDDSQDEEYDSDEDEALLNGEDDVDVASSHANGMPRPTMGAKKRKKKKKRTKR